MSALSSTSDPMPMASSRFPDYKSFSPFYLKEHSDPRNRALHVAGTLLTLVFAALSVLASWRYLLLVPIAGYGFAWIGHFIIERNRPATFIHPLWSLISDYRMTFLVLKGI